MRRKWRLCPYLDSLFAVGNHRQDNQASAGKETAHAANIAPRLPHSALAITKMVEWWPPLVAKHFYYKNLVIAIPAFFFLQHSHSLCNFLRLLFTAALASYVAAGNIIIPLMLSSLTSPLTAQSPLLLLSTTRPSLWLEPPLWPSPVLVPSTTYVTASGESKLPQLLLRCRLHCWEWRR